jgi:hypothetical protein
VPLLQWVLLFVFCFPEIVMVHIARDMKHPRPEIALTAKEIAILENPIEDVLNQVLTEFGVFVHAVEETKQRFPIALKQEAQSVQVAFFYLDHQGIIG